MAIGPILGKHKFHGLDRIADMMQSDREMKSNAGLNNAELATAMMIHRARFEIKTRSEHFCDLTKTYAKEIATAHPEIE
ncbi:hypothetical protein N0V86_004699 [Didymella sp. IMI 355093]|nr:hypothetical protein N0V86_004699 [Didymella sp. IMI 355093]